MSGSAGQSPYCTVPLTLRPRYCRSGATVAVKVVSKAAARAQGPHMVARVVAEVETHATVKHPHVVDLLVRAGGATGASAWHNAGC
jgi:hypothetical protein